MGIMHPVYAKLAELHTLNKKRPLSDVEVRELSTCLEWNANLCWKVAKLENLSLAAFEVNDTNWQHEICAEIDKVKGEITT